PRCRSGRDEQPRAGAASHRQPAARQPAPARHLETTREGFMRRSLTTLLVLGIVGFAAAAYAETRITFRFNDAESKAMRVALDKFEAANPDIKVTLQTTGWKDARDQFLREAAVGQGPDVVHSAFVWTKEFGTAGAVRALDDLIAKDPLPKGLDDFIAIDL